MSATPTEVNATLVEVRAVSLLSTLKVSTSSSDESNSEEHEITMSPLLEDSSTFIHSYCKFLHCFIVAAELAIKEICIILASVPCHKILLALRYK